jgi:hypothetical protein
MINLTMTRTQAAADAGLSTVGDKGAKDKGDKGERHLSKGQQAMLLAMLYPEPEKGGKGKNVAARKAAESAGFGATRLRQARSVLRHSRPLAESVVKGSVSFDDAPSLRH